MSQLADDTTVFLRDSNEIPVALSVTAKLSSISRLKVNLKKSEILPLYSTAVTEICGIPVKNTATYLGVKISTVTGVIILPLFVNLLQINVRLG